MKEPVIKDGEKSHNLEKIQNGNPELKTKKRRLRTESKSSIEAKRLKEKLQRQEKVKVLQEGKIERSTAYVLFDEKNPAHQGKAWAYKTKAAILKKAYRAGVKPPSFFSGNSLDFKTATAMDLTAFLDSEVDKFEKAMRKS